MKLNKALQGLLSMKVRTGETPVPLVICGLMGVMVLLAPVLVLGGCAVRSNKYVRPMDDANRNVGLQGGMVGEVDGRGTLEVKPIVTSTSVTESAGTMRGVPSVRALVDGRSGDDGVKASDGGEGDLKVGRCIDEAFEFLMDGDAQSAVDRLTEAQTVPGWAQCTRAASVLYWLGQSYERLNERTAAMASYRKMLRLYPDSVWARRARKRLTALESGWSVSGYGKNGA